MELPSWPLRRIGTGSADAASGPGEQRAACPFGHHRAHRPGPSAHRVLARQEPVHRPGEQRAIRLLARAAAESPAPESLRADDDLAVAVLHRDPAIAGAERPRRPDCAVRPTHPPASGAIGSERRSSARRSRRARRRARRRAGHRPRRCTSHRAPPIHRDRRARATAARAPRPRRGPAPPHRAESRDRPALTDCRTSAASTGLQVRHPAPLSRASARRILRPAGR